MTAVVGIDPSLTGTAVCDLHGSRLLRQQKMLTGMQRLDVIEGLVKMVVGVNEVEGDGVLVVIEGYSHAARHQAHALGELGGVLRLSLHRAGVPYVDIAPTKRAMFATGKGNANKAAVVSAAASRSGLEFSSDDEADALVLYCMGRQLLGLEHPLGSLPKTHLRALDGVQLPEGLNEGKKAS